MESRYPKWWLSPAVPCPRSPVFQHQGDVGSRQYGLLEDFVLAPVWMLTAEGLVSWLLLTLLRSLTPEAP